MPLRPSLPTLAGCQSRDDQQQMAPIRRDSAERGVVGPPGGSIHAAIMRRTAWWDSRFNTASSSPAWAGVWVSQKRPGKTLIGLSL
jgi:hypothetical protein